MPICPEKLQNTKNLIFVSLASLMHILSFFFHSRDNFLLPVSVGRVAGLKMILIYPENWFPMNKLADLSRETQWAPGEIWALRFTGTFISKIILLRLTLTRKIQNFNCPQFSNKVFRTFKL